MDQAARHLDVIGFNRYNGWYQNAGRTDMITDHVIQEAIEWHTKFEKPVIMFEYGADSMPGMHTVYGPSLSDRDYINNMFF